MEVNGNAFAWRTFWRSPEFWISLLSSILFYTLVRSFEGAAIPEWPYHRLMGQTSGLILLLAMGLVAWKYHARSWAPWLLVHLVALITGSCMLLDWQAFPVGPGAVDGDAWFNTAMIVKAREGWLGGDFTYKGLHGFYPGFYQTLTGGIAWLTGTQGHLAVKYGIYWVAFLLPLGVYHFWRKLLPQLPALLMAVIAMWLCRPSLSFKPYEMLVSVLFIPWALYYIAGLRLRTGEAGPRWDMEPVQGRAWIAGGIWAGLLFSTFYYYFALLVLWFPAFLLYTRSTAGWAAVWNWVRPVLKMAGLALLVSAWYWAPLLLDMVQYGAVSMQNRWFQPHMISLPLEIISQWQGMLGLVSLCLLAVRSRLAGVALTFLLGVLAFMLVGHIGVYFNVPLLHFRMVLLDQHLLHLGIVLGIMALLPRLDALRSGLLEWILIPALSAVFLVNYLILNGYHSHNEEHRLAREFRMPALLGLSEFNAMARGKVFLTNRVELAALKPMYLYLGINAHFNHPAARFHERLKLLVLLQESRNSDFIAWMLYHNRYDRVDYIILDDNAMHVLDDSYTVMGSHNIVPLRFTAPAFRGQYFRQHAGMKELIAVQPVPEAVWKTFNPAERRIAALFSDVAEVNAAIPASEKEALQNEIRIRTWKYTEWKDAFYWNWSGE